MEKTLDLKTLWHMFAKHIIFILGITILITGTLFSLAYFVIPPKYTSEALLYVENKQNAEDNLNINDITAAQKLVATCSILFASDSILEKLKTNLNLSYSLNTLSKMISIESVNQSEIIKMTVITKYASESEKIASELVELSQSEFLRIIKSGTIELVSEPKVSNTPVSPNIPLCTAVGFMAGLMISCVIVIIRGLFDVNINEEDDLYKSYNIPVFAEIINFKTKMKGDYKYE